MKTHFVKRLLLLSVVPAAAVLSAGNLLRNSSFELGQERYGSVRCKEITSIDIQYPGPEAEIDSTTAVQGKNSLKLELKKAEETVGWRFTTHEFDLKPGKTYTFSFAAKSSTPGSKINFICGSNQFFWQWHSGKIFKLTDQWQRYSLTVKIPPLKKGQTKNNEKFWMVLKTVTDCTVWLDALNLEEGKSAEWKPAAPCESVVSVPDILVDKDSVTAKVSAVSYDADCSFTANLKLDFISPAKKISERKVDFKLKKGEAQTVNVVLSKIPYGAYKISTIPGVTEHTFVRVHDNKAVFGSGFQLGLISAALESTQEYNAPDGVHLFWNSVFGKPGELGKKLRLAGITWNNPWGGISSSRISVLQPEKGKFDWLRTDLQIANAKKQNIRPAFAIATQSLLVNRAGKDQGKFIAQWLRDSDRFGKPEGQQLGRWNKFKIVLPPAQIIADHIKAMVQKYPNEFEYFMIFAEYNGYMTDEMIIEYAKAIEPVIRKYSPKTKFIAYNPTGDFNGKVANSYANLIKAGAGKYTHAYAFHPYDTPMDNSPAPAHHAIREIKKTFREAGVDKELWNTEVYYLHPIRKDNYNYEAAAITRRIAIDMGEGVRASSPLPYRAALFNNNITPCCTYNSAAREPNEKFAAYNAAGYFLNGAVPVSTLENNSILGYTFKNHGKYYSVLWSKSGKTFVTLKGNPKIYDFYGNPLKVKLKCHLVNREPLFMDWGKTNPAKILSQGVFTGQNDFIPSDLKRVPGGIGLRLRNESGRKIGGSLRLVSPYIAGAAVAEFAPFDNETTVIVPAEIKPDAPEIFEVKINLSGHERLFSIKRTFNNVPVLRPSQEYKLGNNSFTVRSKDGVLTVDIQIPECSRKSGEHIWEGDCVEIYIDSNPLAGNTDNMSLYHPEVSQSIFSLAKDGNNVKVTEIYGRRGLKADIMPGVKARATVPVKAKYIHFNIGIRNNNKYNVLRGKQNFKNRSQFVMIDLEKK